ncbi:MAG: SpoIIE family protein phosphatase [Bacteroidota bacterium]
MNQPVRKNLIGPSIAGMIGVIIYFILAPSVSPKLSVNLSVSRSEAVTTARQYLMKMGYDASAMSTESSFLYNTAVNQFFASKVGTAQANRILSSDSLDAHRWQIYFFEPRSNVSQMKNQYRVWISQRGTVVGFTHTIQDSAGSVRLTEDSARVIAENFLRGVNIDLHRFTLVKSSSINQVNRRDHTFLWACRDSILDGRIEVTVWIQGNEIGRYTEEFTPPGTFTQFVADNFAAYAIFSTISYVLIFLMVLFAISVFLKKYHEGEVGVRTSVRIALFLFSIVFVTYVLDYEAIGIGVSLGDVNRTFVKITMFVISLVVVYGFLSAMTFAAWSVGESSARHGWSGKLSGIDSLLQQKYFTEDVSSGIFHGTGFGLGIIGLLTAAYWMLERFFAVSPAVIGLNGVAESYFPALYVVLGAVSAALISEIVFRLFVISWIKEKFKKTWIGVIISSFLWMLTATTLWETPFGLLPLIWQFVIFFISGLFFSFVFLRYGLLSAIIANIVVYSVITIEPFLFSTGSYAQEVKIYYGILFILPLIAGIIGYVRKEEFQFTADSIPSHIKRISERERMAKELEIARNVQMSLLPKENPQVQGFDIAGICIPAFEVGGDYYDFVSLGTNKIGIAIGDVSGKGVPAAIYMTLTKGILQSHAEENISPKNVLSKVNKLLYKTIEKNSFVSMFYAIIDVPAKSIRYSRAGHNPVILAGLRDDQREFLTPKGVALGLDDGGIFDAVLEEGEYQLQSGDLLVFYTDGFTEARNEQGEEFTEHRLLDAVGSTKNKPAVQILDDVVSEVKRFIGDAQQHDDMTMVVVKVL